MKTQLHIVFFKICPKIVHVLLSRHWEGGYYCIRSIAFLIVISLKFVEIHKKYDKSSSIRSEMFLIPN